MDNDLNVPEAMKHVFDFAREINKLIAENKIGNIAQEEALAFFKKIDSVIGVLSFENKELELTNEQENLITERNKAREEKDWAKADEIRDTLKSQGIELIDKDGKTIPKLI